MLSHRQPIISLVLLSLAPPSASAQNDSASGRIATRTFSVDLPESKGWAWTMRPDSFGIEMHHHKGGIPGLFGLSTPEDITITVFQDSTNRENAARGADVVAQDFIDQEEAQLRADTMRSFRQDITVNSVERRTDKIGGYEVYVFDAQVRVANFSGTVQQDQELVLYLPRDLEDRQQFFVFHMSRVRPNKHGWDKNGFKSLHQVIETFRDDRSRVKVE